MPRLIFHIGFPKCGSTTIFRSFASNLKAMRQQRIFVFNDAFELARDQGELRTPLWNIQKSRTSPTARKHMQDTLRSQIKQAPKDSTLILSSEVLGPASRKGMFTGFDDIADVEVIGYFRPQVDWIPSGWKQWESREGIALQDATARYVTEHKPNYRMMMDNWQASLPKARTRLRLFARGALVNQHPFDDFMTQIGFEYDTLETLTDAMNPSIDYALLHLMMRHHDLFFRSRHDSRLMHAFVKRLPNPYLKTNAPMLNTQMLGDITEAFRDDNIAMLSSFLPAQEVEATFNRFFVRPAVPDGIAYPDFTEDHILSRAAGILSETMGLRVENVTTDSRPLAVALYDALAKHWHSAPRTYTKRSVFLHNRSTN